MSPYGRLLDSCCDRDWMKAALAPLAAHATVGPDTAGGAFYVMWQAAYHRYGMWHPRGGSGALTEALRRRLDAWGGGVSLART
jgi:phytoene dehydrogenase-like protein